MESVPQTEMHPEPTDLDKASLQRTEWLWTPQAPHLCPVSESFCLETVKEGIAHRSIRSNKSGFCRILPLIPCRRTSLALSRAVCWGCPDRIARAEISVNAKRLFKRGWREWSACSDREWNHKKTRRVNTKAKGLQAVERKWQVMNSGPEGGLEHCRSRRSSPQVHGLKVGAVPVKSKNGVKGYSFSHVTPED